MITIRSINGEILTHFDNSVPNGNPYFEPVMTDDMESLVSSFSFSVPLELEDTVYLQGLNQVLTKDRHGDLRLFIITDVYEEWTTVGGIVRVECEDISISEMNDIVVNPFNGINFNDTLYKTFEGSGWKLEYGANWEDVDNTTMVLEEYDNMRSVIASIVDTYGCQFKFKAQENQYGEITRVAEVYKTRGTDTGKYFYYDRDLLGIERDIQHSNIKTAIHAYYTGYNGKTYTLNNFVPVNPDPDFRKDKNSTLIINKEASKLYDDGNSYRIIPYKAQVEGDPELVYREAIKELKKYAEPIYTYKVNVILLQNLHGWDGEDIELGDTVWMKERVGNRELGLEARVTAYEYHEDDPSSDVVTFSNFREIDTTDAKEIAERVFIAYANSPDGRVDFSIDDSTNRAYMGVYTSATRTQSPDPDTYTWSRTKGEDGNSAPSLDLTASQQVMKLKADGTPDGAQTITFAATKQNSTTAVVWEAIPYKGNLEQPAITLGGTGDVRTLTSAQWDKDWTRLQVTVTMGNLKDIQTIVMVSDGATGASGTAIVGFLTNESTTFAANPEGVVDDYSNGSGRFVIYEGTKEVTSGVAYTKVSSVGINFLINATTGEYIVSNMTQDHAQAVVKAVYKEVTITKFLSFAKSKQGAKGDRGDQGIAGEKGVDGKTQYTHIAYADDANGGGFSQDPANKAYIGMYVDFEEMDSTDPKKYAWSLIKGADGKQGVAGQKGEDGRTPYFHTAYINDTDFGTYDYSGNPNLFVNTLKSSDFIKGSHGSLTDDGEMLHFTSDGTGDISMFTRVNTSAVTSGKTYTLSAKLRFDEGTTGDINKLRLVYRKTLGGDVLLEANNTSMTIDDVGKEIIIKGTSKVAYQITALERFYISVSFSQNGKINGGFKLSHIKIEEGSTATPYQPNLLDAPYYFSTVPLEGNIADPSVSFPIKTSAYRLYGGSMLEDFKIGQRYTLTMKATKPASQTFWAYNGGNISLERMTPVEGLTDVWSCSFTVLKIDSGSPRLLNIYQTQQSTVGACQIDWLKIEKGDTRTPNISAYKYLGTYTDFVQDDSLNPTKYSWSLIKGADGADGQDGAPAQLLTLQSDTPVMRFDSADVVVSGQVVTFNAFKQGIESGIIWTATPYKGNTAQPNITLGGTSDTRTLNASQWDSGVTTIKVVVNAGGFTDTVTITKVKDGAKGDKGDSGADGIAGKDGVGLKSTTITYAASASGTVAPSSGWQAQVPTVAPNNFLWTKTEWTYTDLSKEVGYSVAKMGANGAKGDDGIAGKDGVGIEDTLIEYATNASGTVKPTSGWATSIPVVPAGQFLWTRTTWTYTDNTTEQGFTVAKQGDKGDKGDTGASGKDGIAGKDGVGLSSTTITYASSTSGTTAPTTGWQSQVPTVAPNNYLWTKTIWNYTDGDSETGYSVAKMGADGAKGDDGIAGKDGVGIKTTVIDYVVSTQGTTPPASGWNTTIPVTPEGQYLWTRTKWTYTDNTTETGYSVAKQGAKGATGASGKDGIAGKDGVGIKTTAISYAGSSSGTTAPTTGWQEQVPTVAPNNFLWTRTIWTYTDNTTETGYSVAKMGANGAKGDDGIAGKDGVGIVSTTIEYATSTDGTTKPLTGWTTTVPTVPQGQFLWTRTTWAYSDSTSEQGFTVARQGSNGSNGSNGVDAYSPILTNEAATFAASPSGAVADWSVGNGVFMVYRGTTRLTTGVTYAVESVSYAEGTINASSGAYSITSLSRDNGTITFKATIGSTVLTKTMSLSKSRQGATGAQGVQGTMGIAFYSPTEPTGSTVTNGATWFKTVSVNDNTVVGIYTRKNGAWVETPLASGTLAVQELSAISANIGDITAGNLTGIEITGSKFTNPFDFVAADGNHLQGTTSISDAELDISGAVNAGTASERKFHTSVEPLYFQAVYSDAADNILRSVNVSNSGYTMNDTTSKITTAFSSGQFQAVDNTNGKSVIAGLDSVGIRNIDNSAIMTPRGFFLNNRKNVDIWTGTGDQTNSTPNNARLRFGTFVSYGWGTLPEDNPFEQVAPYLWRVNRETKFSWRINVNVQDATTDYLYFKMYFKDAQDTDVNPQAQIQSGRITSETNNGTGINLRMQNTVFLQGYHKAPAGTYFSLVTECRAGRNCGNIKIENAEFVEIFEY